MKAVRLASGRRVAPFRDPVGETPVLEGTLAQAQERALAEAGCTLVDAAPADEPYLLFSDRLWFTAETVRKVVAAGPGRLVVDDPGWAEALHPLQRLGPQDSYDLAHMAAGAPPELAAAAPHVVDLALHDGSVPPMNHHMHHATRPVRVGAAMALHVDHWVHIVRVNHLALVALGEEARLWWQTHGWFGRIGQVLALLWRARSLNKRRILANLLPVSPKAEIDETAVVIASRVAPGAYIGPHAVVRGSVIGPGARVEDHATVNLSVLGEGSQVERYGMANLCVLYPKATLSAGGGFQFTVLGRGAFVAVGATFLDMSFGKTIQVEDEEGWVDSAQHFVGAAIGHEAVIGNQVRLNYGVSVPNGALLVAPADTLIKDASAAEAGVACRVAPGGGVRPLGRRTPPGPVEDDGAEGAAGEGRDA